MAELRGAQLHVGPAGWCYDDWSGVVYPDPRPRGFRPPTFLAQYFNAIELNNTFYRPPRPDYCRRWVEDVAERDDFLYTAKLYRRFTHERDEPWGEGEVAVFLDAIAPLVEAGRLGALLMQFPWSFRFNAANQRHLALLADEFGHLPLVLEVRHKGWAEERALRFVESLGIGFCNIDQPAYKNNIPLTTHAFGRIGYLRLHGRNYAAWFDEESGRDERYDYLYQGEELDELESAVREISERVERMFVIANNHYRGQAVATGRQLLGRLTGEAVEYPGRVGELYGLA